MSIGMETTALGLFNSQCLSVHPAALSLKGTPSICVNPWAAGDTVGNKHYHCWEWLDIDTASPTPTKPVTADWQKKGWGGLGGNMDGRERGRDGRVKKMRQE